MKVHEYQGKDVLREYGVPVPKGKVAFSADEAEAARLAQEAEAAKEEVVIDEDGEMGEA